MPQSISDLLVNRSCSMGYNNNIPGFFDYWFLARCAIPWRWVSVVLSILWLIFLNYLLISTTKSYFYKTISRLSSQISISSKIFGVTFLAISFVSGDFFVASAATYYGENDAALGGILGSTLFVLTVPAGAVMLADKESEISVYRRPFFRDLFFTLVCCLTVLLLWLKNKLEFWMSLIMLGIYILYLAVVIVGRYVYQKTEKQKRRRLGIIDETSDKEFFELAPGGNEKDQVSFLADVKGLSSDSEFLIETVESDPEENSGCMWECSFSSFTSHLSQFGNRLIWDGTTWSEKSTSSRFSYVLVLPTIILRNLTIPTGPDAQWSKGLLMVTFIVGPMWLLICTDCEDFFATTTQQSSWT
eukprot:TRINITY_DN3801_c0_g1_i3.p1 TRINITY_DN3801_c0_g1~~TRINITY_DN3801_c0_g1_i3.p1  ORF type:complete len:358 (-),score=64.06 TRINITY_DN3801_c0_g1_i3:1196-2269(-)